MRRLPNLIVAFIVAGGFLLVSAAIVKLAEYVHNNCIILAIIYILTYWIVALMRMDG